MLFCFVYCSHGVSVVRDGFLCTFFVTPDEAFALAPVFEFNNTIYSLCIGSNATNQFFSLYRISPNNASLFVPISTGPSSSSSSSPPPLALPGSPTMPSRISPQYVIADIVDADPFAPPPPNCPMVAAYAAVQTSTTFQWFLYALCLNGPPGAGAGFSPSSSQSSSWFLMVLNTPQLPSSSLLKGIQLKSSRRSSVLLQCDWIRSDNTEGALFAYDASTSTMTLIYAPSKAVLASSSSSLSSHIIIICTSILIFALL